MTNEEKAVMEEWTVTQEEAEAEMYANKKHCSKCINCGDCIESAIEDRCDAYRESYADYLAGIKAGKPKWHDLRENPEDLPTETGHYLTDDGEYIYDTDYKKWRTLTCMACWDSSWLDDGDVIAWCELPKFEEKK